MKKWNLRQIMTRAWRNYRKNREIGMTFGEALHRAWLTAKAEPVNAAIIEAAKADAGITEEVNTWSGWRDAGREVIHGSKHLFGGDLSWLSEQTLREIYLKPFEYTVKLGETRGLMSSFNRIGTRWTGGDYRLLTEILRDEWGFNGYVICDFNTIPQYMIPRQMFYAGGSLDLATLASSMWTDCDSSENGDAIVLRRATKDLLYAFVNSNAMNAEVIGYDPPAWHNMLKWINIGLVALVVIWGVLAFLRRFSYNKKQKAKASAS